MAHSFGLEALVFDEDIEHGVESCARSLGWYLEDSLSESLLVDAVFCREAHTRALEGAPILDLNRQISALRLARESREASLTLGSRFAALAASLHPSPALASSREHGRVASLRGVWLHARDSRDRSRSHGGSASSSKCAQHHFRRAASASARTGSGQSDRLGAETRRSGCGRADAAHFVFDGVLVRAPAGDGVDAACLSATRVFLSADRDYLTHARLRRMRPQPTAN